MQKMLSRIEKTFRWLAVSALVLMTLLTTLDTGGRYLLNSPVPGSYELIEKYLMVFSVFFALCFTYREGTHIRLTLITGRLRLKKVKLACNYVAQVLTILFNAFLFAASTKLCISGVNEVWDATKFKIPMFPAYLVAAVGLFFTCLWMIADLWQVRKEKSCLFKEEESGKEDGAALI